MKILITGIAGFAGSNIASGLISCHPNIKIFGIDNFSRKGCEQNIDLLNAKGIKLIRGDLRLTSDIDTIPQVDWVIDCAANPSVLGGLDGQVSSKQVIENNLLGTVNLLEFCKKYQAGLILISTSHVYSALELANLPVKLIKIASKLITPTFPVTDQGISENFLPRHPFPYTEYQVDIRAANFGIQLLISSLDQSMWGSCWAGQFGKADRIFSTDSFI